VDLVHFDNTVQHDVDNSMIPFMAAAQQKVKARGAELKLLASPWSPPAWMKVPVPVWWDAKNQSQVRSARPNGLLPEMQRPWAKYFSKWITAYKSHGIDIWAVTVQNEPEAAPNWEAMLWTPEFMATFVRDHLGPVLEADHPSVGIFGFDHNKDHVVGWTQGLYADEAAKKYMRGVAVHWYGGLNGANLDAAHAIAPEKEILATEACNCIGNVVLRTPSLAAWWTRAELLALDMIEDLKHWATGWIDWNLIVSPQGGPNHLKNLCDANIIADPQNTTGFGTNFIKQASFYYMGQFSRYLRPGMRAVKLTNLVETELPPIKSADIKNGAGLVFMPCEKDSAVQLFRLTHRDSGTFIVAAGTNEAPGSDGYGMGGECVEICISGECWFPKIQLWTCKQESNPDALHGATGNQAWEVKAVDGGSQIVNPAIGKCLTAVKTAGWTVGLDAGLQVTGAQAFPCYPAGTKNQTFVISGEGDVTVKSADDGNCLAPPLQKLPHFDAVAFEHPDDGEVAMVVMNTNDDAMDITIKDATSDHAVVHSVPGHAIHTYRWRPSPSPSLPPPSPSPSPSPSPAPAPAPAPAPSPRPRPRPSPSPSPSSTSQPKQILAMPDLAATPTNAHLTGEMLFTAPRVPGKEKGNAPSWATTTVTTALQCTHGRHVHVCEYPNEGTGVEVGSSWGLPLWGLAAFVAVLSAFAMLVHFRGNTARYAQAGEGNEAEAAYEAFAEPQKL